MSPDQIPINWFDLALVIVLGLGIWRGRKHGMSEETLPLAKWLVAVFGAALAYEPVGRFIANNSPLGLLFCYVVGYLTVMMVVFALFALLKRGLGGKLLGSDFFGRSEYYLGMGGGMIRFACGLLAVLAVLNARLYTSDEVRAMQRFQMENYGSSFFPTLQNVQASVFVHSFTGRFIKQHGEMLLIQPTLPGGAQLQRPKTDLPGL
jgi:uncharacterized membrane protein required for colicin V production